MGRKWKFSRRRTDSKSSNQNSFKKNNQFPSSPTFVIKKGKGNRDHRLKIKKKLRQKKRIDCNHLRAKEKHRVLVKVIPLGREKGRKMVKFRVVSPTNVTSPAGPRPPFKRSPTVKSERGSCVRYDGMNEWTPRKGRLHSILFFFWGGGNHRTGLPELIVDESGVGSGTSRQTSEMLGMLGFPAIRDSLRLDAHGWRKRKTRGKFLGTSRASRDQQSTFFFTGKNDVKAPAQ